MNTLQAQTAYIGSTEIKQVRLGNELVLAPNGDELWYKANELPSLDLRFADDKSLVDATTGANLVDFTRASSGTYVDSEGVIQIASTDEPRFDHDPATGESLGLLMEEQRTNTLLQSNGFDTTWTNTNSSETSASGIAPDGSNTAWLLQDTLDGSAVTHTVRQIISFDSGTTYTLSLYAKASSIEGVHLLLPLGAFGVNTRANYDLINGTTDVTEGTATAEIQNAGGGWYRCIITATATASASIGMQIRTMKIVSGSLTSFYPGDGTGTILIWGAQLEAGSFPTSYIPTTAATATRAADVASISGSNFSSWYRQDEGTVFVNGITPPNRANFPSLNTLHDGTSNNRLLQYVFTSGYFSAARVGSVPQGDNTAAVTPTDGSAYKIASAFAVNNSVTAVNGVTGSVDTLCLMPTALNTLAIGAEWNNANIVNSTIRRLTYWPARLPDSTLQTITQ